MTGVQTCALPILPKKLIIIGGGAIGLELGQVYASLGSKLNAAGAGLIDND